MANTYFKYAERNAENRINWADVGKDMTDMLADEARVRGEKKAAIETDFREFGKTLAESPMGESQGFNEFTTDYADSAQEYSLMVNNMLKSGDLKLRDYNNIQANLKQGTSEAFSIAEDYNKAYEGMLERGEIDPETGLPSAQLLEQYVLGTVQGFGNYSNHRLWINPTSGRVSLGTTRTDEETGEVTMDRDTGSFIAVNALRNRTRAQYDTYDLNKINAARVDTLGTTIDAVMSGGVKTREKALENASVRQVLDDFADATVAIPTNVSSILTNSLGTNPANGGLYGFTDNPAEAAADENLILLMDNPLQKSAGLPMPAYLDSPEKLTEYLKKNFGSGSNIDSDADNYVSDDEVAQIVANNKKQVDVARDVTKTSLVSMLDREETTMAEFDPSRYEWNAAKLGVEAAEEAQADAVALWSEIWYLEPEEKQTALDAILTTKLAVGRSLKSITINGNQLDFKYSGKNAKMDHSVTMPATPTKEDWIRLGGQIYDVNKATVADGRWKDTDEYTGFEETLKDINGKDVTKSKKYEVKRAGDPVVVDKVAQTRALISESIKADWFDDKDDVKMIPNFMAALRSLGITVKNQGYGGENLIFTSGTDKTGITLNTNNNSADARTARENLLAWARLQVSKDNAEIYMSSNGGIDYSKK